MMLMMILREARRQIVYLTVGELNNDTDAHFGSRSFVTQQFRVGELRNVAWAESLSS